MMAAMDYLLTPEQKALKEAIRDFIALEIPSLRSTAAPDGKAVDAFVLKLGRFLRRREGRPDVEEGVPLSGVETVLVLEEVLKGLPGAGSKPAAGRLFEGLSLELRSSAACLGSAQGVLVPCLERAFGRRGLDASGHHHEALNQGLADILSAIEAARLMTYRAAILEDEGHPDAEEAAEAKRQAEELASRAARLAALIEKGEENET